MGSSNIKINFGYNILLTMSTYIFGLIVFPYITRVLGVDMMGRVNFASQTIDYLRIFAAMGVATVGIREIASCGSDRAKRSQVFSDIISLLLILSLAFTLVLFVFFTFIPKFSAVKDLLVVGSFYLFFSTMMIEWFYQGLEEFKFVTIRSIIVKSVYVALVFLFVKCPEDYLKYYILVTGSIVINALINLGYSKRFVDFSLKDARPLRYLKSIFSLGIYSIMISFFTTFNVVYLGFVQGEHAVGVYTVATKIYGLILGVLTAYTAVMMPRMSALLSENRTDEFKKKVRISFELVFSVSLPLLVGGVIMAPQIVGILAGSQYSEAIPVMRMIMPLVFVIGMAQIWVIQILLPMKKDNIVLVSASISAAVGIILNFLLVGKLSFVGSAIAMLAAEITNDAITLVYAIRGGYLDFPVGRLLKNLVSSIPYLAVCLLCALFIGNIFVSLGVAVAVCLIWFVAVIKWKKTSALS